MSEKKLKVKLVAYTTDPEQVVTAAIRQCYSRVGADDLRKKIDKKTRKRLTAQVISSGHTSTIEHANFTFSIEGVSRACTHQLVRHRIASYSQQSQRYVSFDKSGFDYVIPPSIKNDKKLLKEFDQYIKDTVVLYKKMIKSEIPAEDARFILPNAAETKIVVTMNGRSLLNFFKERMCARAQWEIRALANEMYKLVIKAAPNIFKYAGPTCETEKICWQGNLSCGKWKKIKEAELRVRK
jgi:thymidylate synthase (FAD)